MTAIADRLLSTRYNAIERNQQTIDSSNVMPLLAAIADRWYANADKMLEKLQKASTKEEQLQIVKDGLTKGEAKDIATILDKGTAKIAPEWRNFFEAVLDRAPLDTTPPPGPGPGPGPQPSNGPLQITGFANGLQGTAEAGVTVEAINLTTAPAGRLHTDDTVEVAKAGADGKFTGALVGNMKGTQDGDVIRMRTRDASGKVSDWVTVRAFGIGSGDTRNAVVALLRIGLSHENGKVAITNINASRQISEPGAVLEFTNKTSGKKVQVTLDAEGTFPAGFSIPGRPGDVLTVAATDGTNNKDFKELVGEVTVPSTDTTNTGGTNLPDPALHHDELDANGKPRFQTARFSGPLFVNEPSPLDVRQGQIGDCYFPSGCAAVAKGNPEAIKNAIKDNKDGTYTVSFYEKDWRTSSFKKVEVKIDGDLYVRSSGMPLYGATTGQNATTNMEMWFPLLEKAWAQWKGSYDAIGNGGSAGDVMTALLGRDAGYAGVSSGREEQIWKKIKTAMDAKLPAALGTGDDEKKYAGTGIYGDHSYSVLGYKEENGKRYVQIRNPWGESEPINNGDNDGVFYMEISTVCKLYESLDVVS